MFKFYLTIIYNLMSIKIIFNYTYAADDENDFFSFSLDGGLDNATVGGATVIGVGALLIIVGCAIIFGDGGIRG
jgi:hypothetical protein